MSLMCLHFYLAVKLGLDKHYERVYLVEWR